MIVSQDFTEKEIQNTTKIQWKTYIHEKVKIARLEYLNEENSNKSIAKHFNFETLNMSDYLVKNKNTSISKIIFSVRAGTLDLKAWNDWKYVDKLCVMCGEFEEDFEHFMSCTRYGHEIQENNWKDIFEDDSEKQYSIALEVKRRTNLRKSKLEAGLPHLLAPMLQDSVELTSNT